MTIHCFRSPESSEYVVSTDTILALLLYPRYLTNTRDMLGDNAEMVVEHLVRVGQDSMTNTLVELGRALVQTDTDMSREALARSLSNLQEMFKKLVKMDFIQHGDPLVTSPANHGVLDIVAVVTEDIRDRLEDRQMFHLSQTKVKQIVRDRIIAEAAERRLCGEAGRVMTSVLRLCDAQPGAGGASPHVSQPDIERRLTADHGGDTAAAVYLDQYLRYGVLSLPEGPMSQKITQFNTTVYHRTMAGDRVRWVDRVGDSGGGQYQVSHHVHLNIHPCVSVIMSILTVITMCQSSCPS